MRRMFGKLRKETDTNEQHPGGLTREHVVWAYRLLLDRDPMPPRPTSDYQDLLREDPQHGGAIRPPWEEIPEGPESGDPDGDKAQPA